MKGFLMSVIIKKQSSRVTWEAVDHAELGSKTKKEVKKEILDDFPWRK